MISGHITICKVYKDGTEETVLDRANMIVAGLGSSFLDIQKGVGSTVAADYAPAYFQIGTGAPSFNAVDTSGFWYQVCAPISWQQYGEDTDLTITERYRGFYASSVIDGIYQELEQTKAPLSSVIFSGSDGYFANIARGSVTKNFLDSFEAQIVLDENTANGLALTEVGLFAKNPKGFYLDTPVMMAYRSFAALNKTSEFSLVINWSIGFLGLDSNVDNHYSTGDIPNT
jgi:hypothetical protein